MKSRFLIIFTCAAFSQMVVSRASAADPGVFGAPMREVRETPRLDFGVISKSETWAVTRFMPRSPGTTPMVQVMRRDPKQRFLVPAGPPEGPLVVGKLKIVSLLTVRSKPLINSYKWTVPAESLFLNGPRDLEREDTLVYSVFIDGGTAICKIDTRQSGEAQFTPAFAIPTAWQGAVVPAYRFYSAHRDLFASTPINTTKQKQLQSLMDNVNPFIAVAACRRLNEAGKLDAKFVSGSLTRARGLRQAIFVYLLTRGTLKPSQSRLSVDSVQFNRVDLASQAARLVKSQGSSGLRDLAVGVFAAGVSDAYDPFEKKRVLYRGFGPQLLNAIAQRTRELKITKPRNQNERELLSLLQFAKLR